MIRAIITPFELNLFIANPFIFLYRHFHTEYIHIVAY
nr:MAG TPA: hypothetical protein [Siphoviridae sp. ct6662]